MPPFTPCIVLVGLSSLRGSVTEEAGKLSVCGASNIQIFFIAFVSLRHECREEALSNHSLRRDADAVMVLLETCRRDHGELRILLDASRCRRQQVAFRTICDAIRYRPCSSCARIVSSIAVLPLCSIPNVRETRITIEAINVNGPV